MVTSRRKPILTVIEDTGPGVHDTLVAACDHHLYEQQLGIKPEVGVPRRALPAGLHCTKGGSSGAVRHRPDRSMLDALRARLPGLGQDQQVQTTAVPAHGKSLPRGCHGCAVRATGSRCCRTLMTAAPTTCTPAWATSGGS